MSSDYRERADDDARDAEYAEGQAMQAEYEWRDRHLADLEVVLNALGPSEVLHHVAGFLSRPKLIVQPVPVDVEPF